MSEVYIKIQQTFSIKGKMINIFIFYRPFVSAATAEVSCCVKAVINNMLMTQWVWLCSNKALFIKIMPQIRFSSELLFDDPDLDPWISGHAFMSYLQALNYRYILNINGYAIRFWKPILSELFFP